MDDYFILWQENLDKHTEFKNMLNNLSSNIQFTIEFNTRVLDFLDLLITNTDGGIKTDRFYKFTDFIHYLLFTSCLPRYTKLTICTIVSDLSKREKRLVEWKDVPIKRAFPLGIIPKGINWAKHIDVQGFRKMKKTKQGKLFYHICQPSAPETSKYLTTSTKYPSFYLKSKKLKWFWKHIKSSKQKTSQNPKSHSHWNKII